MSDNPVVPEDERARLPTSANLEVGGGGEATEEKSKDSITLGLGDADDPPCEACVDKDRLETGDRVDPDHGVDGLLKKGVRGGER